MAEIADVIAGGDVDAVWGNAVKDRSTMRYINLATLEVQEPTAGTGALRWADDVGLVFWDGADWVGVAAADLYDLSTVVDSKIATATQFGGWIAPALQNNWVNFGAGEQTARYRHEQNGRIVRIQGLLKDGSVPINTTMFTLNPGYRPLQNLQVATTSNNAYGQIKVNASGIVAFRAGTNANLSLDCTFPIDS